MIERKRHASVINTFYIRTQQPDQPQIAEFSLADISKAMLLERFVFVLYINILPDITEDSFENYRETDQETNNSNWYNNHILVGKIG